MPHQKDGQTPEKADFLVTAILDAAKRSLVDAFNKGTFIMPDYANRMRIPADLVQQVYSLIDYKEVLDLLRPKINQMVADRIAATIAQSLTTDVKGVLGNEEMRKKLRTVVAATITEGHGD
jgi:hypothetical protein